MLDCHIVVCLPVTDPDSVIKPKYNKTVESKCGWTEQNKGNEPDQEAIHCTDFPVKGVGQHLAGFFIVVGEATGRPVDADGDHGSVVGPDYHVPHYSRVQAQGSRAPEMGIGSLVVIFLSWFCHF